MIDIVVSALVTYLQSLQRKAQNELGNYRAPEYEFEFNHTI